MGGSGNYTYLYASTMQPLAVVTKLLLLLLGTSHSSAQDSVNCRAGIRADTRICNELFQAFQAAIVTNTSNLYNLRKIFFPSTDPEPTLLNVNYELAIEWNDTDVTVNYSNHRFGWTSQSIYTVFHPATLNRLQPQLIYEMMTELESSNEVSPLPWEGTGQFLTLHLFLYVKMSHLPSGTQITETLQDLTSVLKEYARDQKNLTEWKTRDSYVLDGRVFYKMWWEHECDIYGVISCHIRYINVAFSLCLTIAGGFAIVALMRLIKGKEDDRFGIAYNKWCIEYFCCSYTVETDNVEAGDTDLQSDITDSVEVTDSTELGNDGTQGAKKSPDLEYPFFHSLLWSATGVLFWGWLAVYITEIIKIVHWWQHNPETAEVAVTITWVSLMLLSGVPASFAVSSRLIVKVDLLYPSSAIWGGICGCRVDIPVRRCFIWVHKHKQWKLHEWILWVTKCTANSPVAKRAAGALPLLVIYLWVGYIALNTVPVILYFLLYPTRVLCLYTYAIAASAFLIFVITEGDYERRTTKKAIKKKNVDTITKIKHHYLVYTSIFGILIVGVTNVVFIVTYRTIVAGGTTGNALYGIFQALIPTLLIGAPAGWIGRRLRKHYRLDKNKPKEKDTPNPHSRREGDCQEGSGVEDSAEITAITQSANGREATT